MPSLLPEELRAGVAPRWAAAIGALLLGILYAALPTDATIVPNWLPLAVVGVILIPISVAEALRRPFPHVTARRLFLLC